MKSKVYLENTAVHLVSREFIAPQPVTDSLLCRDCRS